MSQPIPKAPCLHSITDKAFELSDAVALPVGLGIEKSWSVWVKGVVVLGHDEIFAI